MVNWKPVALGFVVTLILAFIGLFVPYLIILAPIIGGFIAAYLAGGDYRDGTVNGGIAGALGLLVVLAIGFAFFGALAGVLVGSITLGAVTAGIFGAIIGFIIGLILGIIGGLIGIAVKGQPARKPAAEAKAQPTAESTAEQTTTQIRESPNIPFNMDNIPRCLCPTCPVQGESSCAKEKMMKMQEIMQSEEKEKMTPSPEDFAGMYCTNGKASCTDIDTSKYCICEDCSVHKEYDLDNANPTFLYCKDGKAM